MKKKCTFCGEVKALDQFHKKAERKCGLDSRCKNCKEGAKIGYLKRKGINVNEARFKSVVNGLSSIARKVFDSTPSETYWSASRIQSEMFRSGSSQDKSTVSGVLNSLVSFGLVVEPQPGLFSRVKVTKPANKKQQDNAEYATTHAKQKEIEMATEKANPFDAVREVAIKFMDAAKAINALATEIDLRLSDVEKHIAANDQDMANFKQLQSLLKSLG